jgi:hypothetical protein
MQAFFLACYGIPTGIPGILGKNKVFSVKSLEFAKQIPKDYLFPSTLGNSEAFLYYPF